MTTKTTSHVRPSVHIPEMQTWPQSENGDTSLELCDGYKCFWLEPV